jgi:hypothetical protein
MTTNEMEMRGRDSVRVFVTGVCDGLPDLSEALAKPSRDRAGCGLERTTSS